MNDLREQAERFADDLSRTVAAVVGDCEPFAALALETEGVERFSVRQEPDTGIPLKVNGQPLLTLKVSYQCVWDTPQHFLAVHESSCKVYAGIKAAGEPLFRYEYLRRPESDVPGSHLHLHAHRDGLTHVMSRAGEGSRRGKRRARASAAQVPTVSELHFPLGGSRYRPCLEDVLEMLVSELGVDGPADAREALAAGREQWRRTQIRAAVRDAPDEALTVLTQLGYTFTAPQPRPSENLRRLREL